MSLRSNVQRRRRTDTHRTNCYTWTTKVVGHSSTYLDTGRWSDSAHLRKCLNTTRETRSQKRLVKLKRLAQGSSILAALVMIRCHNEVQVGYQLLEAQRGTLGQSSTAIWPCRRTSMSVSDHSSFASLPTHVRQPPVRVIGDRGSSSPSGTTGR